MRFDLTVNLPLLLTLVLTTWSAAAAVAGRFTRLEERLDHLLETLAAHTAQEEKRFDQVGDRLDEHAGTLRTLAVAQARLEAARRG